MFSNIREHAADLRDHDSGTILVLEVQGRGPVSRVVLSDSAGSARAILSEGLVVGAGAKV